MRDIVEELENLDYLGAEGIRKLFVEKDIKGKVLECNSCPVHEWLRKTCTTQVEVYETFVLELDGELSLDMPPNVEAFIRNFDRRMYPELELTNAE